MIFDTFHQYLHYTINRKHGWEVVKIVFSVITESLLGRKTKVQRFEIVQSTIYQKRKVVCNVKFWDYVGDCVIASGVKAVTQKHYREKEAYIAIPGKQRGGDYYTESIVRSILNSIECPEIFVL